MEKTRLNVMAFVWLFCFVGFLAAEQQAQQQPQSLFGRFVPYKQWSQVASEPGTRYVLVTATWCAPCQLLKKQLELIAFPDCINIITVDYDTHSEDARVMLGAGGTLPRLIRYSSDGEKVSGVYWDPAKVSLEDFLRSAPVAGK